MGRKAIGLLERLLRPLRRELTAELAGAFLRLKADAKAQARYEMLASRNSEGTLTPKARAASSLATAQAPASACVKQFKPIG